MHEYFVYMLRCIDGSFYIGITNDIRRRLHEHSSGIDKGCYTYKRLPVELVYSASFHHINDAITWEKHIKRWSRAKKEALIRGDSERLHALAECTNESHYKNSPLSLVSARDDSNLSMKYINAVMVSGDEP